MDGDRFDDLTRRMATGGTTRRRLLRDLGGTVAGAMLVGLGVRSTLAAQDDTSLAVTNAGNGLRASTSTLVNQSAQCDTCNFSCSNCNWTCCGMLGGSHFKPRHPLQ